MTVGVIYLARAANGPAPCEAFLRSYQQNPAGHTQELLIVYKGFTSEDALRPYEALLAEHPHKTFRVSDRGLDLNAYHAAASHFDHEYLLFFNSFSVIQDGDWLAKYMAAMRLDNTGVVGATGTWVSSLTHFLAHYYPDGGRPFYKQLLDFGRRLRKRLDFPPFPNPHVRTNAFMMRRQQMLVYFKAAQRARTKDDAYRFESGKRGLTARLRRQGLEARLVGRNGLSYTPTEWAASDIYRQSRQENLLVTDNQTNIYNQADLPTRELLCREAWGEQARPAV